VSDSVRRSPGEAVAIRELWRGRVFSARPAVLVLDDPSMRMLYTPARVTWARPVGPDGVEVRLPSVTWELRLGRWSDRHVLSFAWPAERYAVLAMWDERWRLDRWYVNVEEPLRETSIGFDTVDLLLDVVIEPDRRSWRWKDEDDLDVALGLGLFGRGDSEEFRAAGERGRRRVMDGLPPFERDWSSWRPDPAWAEPELPEGWELEPE
jgi:hypothetical protein